MLIGLEYVVAAYGIWVVTFAIYIFLTKRSMKNADQTVTLNESSIAFASHSTLPF